MNITFHGATREVTGSCFLVEVGGRKLLVECGLLQGSRRHERHNRDPFPFSPEEVEAVVLTHAHLDHSGRLPLLVKRGFGGRIYTHHATVDLCRILLEDAGYLNEQDALWENRKRERKGLPLLEPLYTRDEARVAHDRFHGIEYASPTEILPGVTLTLRDAGHILGSAITELTLTEDGTRRTVAFSGDLGHRGAPILRDPEPVEQADLIVLESTYGDRNHRDWSQTWDELGEIFANASATHGNILIPAFSVGRTQELLYVFKRHAKKWGLDDWQIFLDSPMAIEATEVYRQHARVYDARARSVWKNAGDPFDLPNLRLTNAPEESMAINRIRAGAIIIAGSGMCTGGRIKHHLKHNVWREHTHVMIVGFQAQGTPGRALVDGARHIRLWGETVQVKARVHTIGGLSAHADQAGLLDWYGNFRDRPPVALVHGEAGAMEALAARLREHRPARVLQPQYGDRLDLVGL